MLTVVDHDEGISLDVGGRVALVTGAGRGVGRRTAIELGRHGARAVVVNDLDPARAEAVADEVRATGAEAVAIACDVSDFDAVGAMLARARAELGPVGVLVNNAGNQGALGLARVERPFWEQGPADWAPSIDVNFDGVLHCTRHALAQMVEAGEGGRIVTVVSDAGRVGEAGGLEVYSGAKAGAAGFTRAMARVGGRHGITANAVSLGATRTPATEQYLADEETVRRMLAGYLVRRFGEPGDGAAAIVFLSSRAAGWITGQTVPVNGGYSLAL